jgi:hypothetical protein
MPITLEVRETHVPVRVPGFRVESLIAVSSFLDNEVVEASDIADLYRQRWRVELPLREIKSMMELDVLRGLMPEMVRQELWSGLLAYNLIRQSMLQSALFADKRPCQIRFTATSQMITSLWLIASLPDGVQVCRETLAMLRIISSSTHCVVNRPDRIEPRAIKRRPLTHDLLMIPRQEAIAKLLKGPAA